MKALRLAAALASLTLVGGAVLFGILGCEETDESDATPTASASASASEAPSASAPSPVASAPTDLDAGAEADAAPTVAERDLTPCCTALRAMLKAAPASQQFAYATASSMCEGLDSANQGRVAFGELARALKGVPIPTACQ